MENHSARVWILPLSTHAINVHGQRLERIDEFAGTGAKRTGLVNDIDSLANLKARHADRRLRTDNTLVVVHGEYEYLSVMFFGHDVELHVTFHFDSHRLLGTFA